MPAPKLKPVEAGDGSYAGRVLEAFDKLSIVFPCPKCGADLYHSGEVTCVDWVKPSADPEGKARADLILECDCGATLNAFVPAEDFQLLEVEP